MKTKISTFIALCLLLTSMAFSQAPNSFKYQSMLRKTDGTPIANQSISVRISILKGSLTGSSVYTETQSATTNSFGILNLSIGEGTVQSGSFATIDWSVSSYFVKIETDETGGVNYTLSSTSQLLSVPYSLYAAKAGNGFSGNYNDLTNKPSKIGAAVIADTARYVKIADSVRYDKYWSQFKAYSNCDILQQKNNTINIGNLTFSDDEPYNYRMVINSADKTEKQGGLQVIGLDTLDVDGNVPVTPLMVVSNSKGMSYGHGKGLTYGRLIGLKRRAINDPNGLSDKFFIGINEQGNFYIGSNAVDEITNFTISSAGKVGLAGVPLPKSGLHLKYGGIYIETPQTYDDSGIIMKTPDGSKCYKITIDNSGNLITNQVSCP